MEICRMKLSPLISSESGKKKKMFPIKKKQLFFHSENSCKSPLNQHDWGLTVQPRLSGKTDHLWPTRSSFSAGTQALYLSQNLWPGWSLLREVTFNHHLWTPTKCQPHSRKKTHFSHTTAGDNYLWFMATPPELGVGPALWDHPDFVTFQQSIDCGKMPAKDAEWRL